MIIKTAKSAGFCPGVKRAVDIVYQQAREAKGPVYTYGPIIHNEEVVKDLAAKGVKVVEGKEGLMGCKGGTVIIRSHGVAREIYELLEKNGIDYVDVTCPFVRKIHRLVEKYTAEGFRVVIIGNGSHPEVEGIRGWGNPKGTTVISNREEARNFAVSGEEKVCVVAQTTFNNNKFQELVEILAKKGYDIIVLNTICDATHKRQTEAREISSQVDAMIVIGGSKSSNTQKLFEICKKECENTYYIQTLDDLDLNQFWSIDNVGITAGASTPNNIIEEVQKNVRSKL